MKTDHKANNRTIKPIALPTLQKRWFFLLAIIFMLLFSLSLTLSGCAVNNRLTLQNYSEHISTTAGTYSSAGGYGFSICNARFTFAEKGKYTAKNIQITFTVLATSEGTSADRSTNTNGILFNESFTESISSLDDKFSKDFKFNCYYTPKSDDLHGYRTPDITITITVTSISGDLTYTPNTFAVFWAIATPILILIIVLSIISHNKFKKKLARVQVGMTLNQAIEILGQPSIYVPAQDGISTAIWQRWIHQRRGGYFMENYCTLTVKDKIIISKIT